mmetsp:Transcript_16161/g.21394  ORF Transcript_16161/g.21394 Transcript_16161/m.21394 type:complete len:166 (+) Transcript_16161:106-603(+)
MLAPRKKYWSSPPEVIDAAIELAQITNEDIVYDIGCGDGQFLVRCAAQTGSRVIGVEIEDLKAEEARARINDAGCQSQVEVITGNALDLDYSDATVIFAALIPRGLRKILPIIQKIPRPLRVVTYLYPFEDLEPNQVWRHHSEDKMSVAWPVYLYHFEPNEEEQK